MEQATTILTNWGGLIGYFIITGSLMEGMKRAVGGKAGDTGFKGVWYCWKRPLAVLFGSLLGLAGHFLQVPQGPFGTGVGGGILAGAIGALVATAAFDQVVGTLRARLAHKLARDTTTPPPPSER